MAEYTHHYLVHSDEHSVSPGGKVMLTNTLSKGDYEKLKELEVKCQFIGANFERKRKRALERFRNGTLTFEDALDQEIRSLTELPHDGNR